MTREDLGHALASAGEMQPVSGLLDSPTLRRPTMAQQPRNPLHGITLETIVTELVEYYGWPELGQQVAVRCFTQDPSVSSSLKFLRRTPWAREKVESLYLFVLRERARQARRS